MLTPDQLRRYFDRLELGREARSIIEVARNSPPARSVDGSYAGAGDIKSLKMGHWVNFESFVPEAAAILAMDVDPDVLEFWDQPMGGFTYLVNGREVRIQPDFLVLRRAGVGFEEWKRQEWLEKEAQKRPGKFIRVDAGEWSAPEREESAKKLGMYYRLRSADEIPAVLVRNVEFLSDYLHEPRSVTEKARARVLAAVESSPGISLLDLINGSSAAKSDDIYALLVEQAIFVDLGNEALGDAASAHVFPSLAMAKALGAVREPLTRGRIPALVGLKLVRGQTICWNGELATVMMTGAEKTFLRFHGKDDVQEWPTPLLMRLASEGAILPSPEAASEQADARLIEQLLSVGPRRIQVALDRVTALASADGNGMSDRTLRRCRSMVAAAGNDQTAQLVALIPEVRQAGGSVLSEAVVTLMEKWIREYYQSPIRPKAKHSYRRFVAEAGNLGFPESQVPSYPTFWRRLRAQDVVRETRRREGSAIADQLDPALQPAFMSAEQWWWLTFGSPRHGDYFMQRVHIDHTQLDIEVIDPKTGRVLGRPWLSVMMDARTRTVLAFYLSLEHPSFRSVMRLLRSCRRRWHQTPKWLVLDRGPEFKSKYLDMVATLLEINILYRPRRKPRAGSVIERLFGTTQAAVIYNLLGNTQATRNPRGMTKQTNPKNLADQSLTGVAQRLGYYLYRTYDRELTHGTLGVKPSHEREEVRKLSGEREHRLVVSDQVFHVMTMPPVKGKGGTRVIGQRGRGIKDSHFRYTAPVLRERLWWGKQVEVRCDPDDFFHIWALLGDTWVECTLRGQFELLRGMSRGEVEDAAEIVRANIRAAGKACEAEAIEVLRQAMRLAQAPETEHQRRRTAANREVDDFFKRATEEQLTEQPGLPVPGLNPPEWVVAEDSEEEAREPALATSAAAVQTDFDALPDLEDLG